MTENTNLDPLKGAPIPPSPDELAMRFAMALMVSGKYSENPAAAIGAAWAIVPEFYIQRLQYATKIAPMFFTVGGQSTDETYNGDVFPAGGDEHPGLCVRQVNVIDYDNNPEPPEIGGSLP